MMPKFPLKTEGPSVSPSPRTSNVRTLRLVRVSRASTHGYPSMFANPLEKIPMMSTVVGNSANNAVPGGFGSFGSPGSRLTSLVVAARDLKWLRGLRGEMLGFGWVLVFGGDLLGLSWC